MTRFVEGVALAHLVEEELMILRLVEGTMVQHLMVKEAMVTHFMGGVTAVGKCVMEERPAMVTVQFMLG